MPDYLLFNPFNPLRRLTFIPPEKYDRMSASIHLYVDSRNFIGGIERLDRILVWFWYQRFRFHNLELFDSGFINGDGI